MREGLTRAWIPGLRIAPRAHARTWLGNVGVWLGIVIAALVTVWTALIIADPSVTFAIVAPGAQSGVQAASIFGRLFAALVLFLFPRERDEGRFEWLAAGLAVLALGELLFGYGVSLGLSRSLNSSLYAWLIVRTLANGLFVAALLPAAVPRLSLRSSALIAGIFVMGYLAVGQADQLLPPLTNAVSFEPAALRRGEVLESLTPGYWALSLLPLLLALAAVAGALRNATRLASSVWILPAMVLLWASQLHNTIWPTAYSPLLTTADILRLAFVAVVAVGAVIELGYIALERGRLLAVEQENARRQAELGLLRTDFTAMVAHELDGPLASIRAQAAVLGTGKLGAEQHQALLAIRRETSVLTTLTHDMQTAAATDRGEFAVRPEVVPASRLLDAAAHYGETFSGDHLFSADGTSSSQMVRADPARVGQVLRNLLENAAKHTPPGTPITLSARPVDGVLLVSVSDQGPGIARGDLQRIFEKFGRGPDAAGQRTPGVGLGLYLSRRIMRAHGSDLRVESFPNVGTTFSFTLELAE